MQHESTSTRISCEKVLGIVKEDHFSIYELIFANSISELQKLQVMLNAAQKCLADKSQTGSAYLINGLTGCVVKIEIDNEYAMLCLQEAAQAHFRMRL